MNFCLVTTEKGYPFLLNFDLVAEVTPAWVQCEAEAPGAIPNVRRNYTERATRPEHWIRQSSEIVLVHKTDGGSHRLRLTMAEAQLMLMGES